MIVYEFKIKGKKSQLRAMDEAILIAQFIRNKAIRHWMDSDKMNKFDLYKFGTALPKEFSFANILNATARQQSIERAWDSISRFFSNCKKKIAGKKGYPKFQKDNRSVEYKKGGWKLIDGCKRIKFTDRCGIGTVKLIGKQHLNQVQDKIQRVRIIKRADGYYIQFVIRVDIVEESLATGSCVGLDVGLSSFFTDSNGRKQDPRQAFKKAEKSVKKAHRSVSKKVKGSNNRKKAVKTLGRKYLKVQRQRKDFAVKTARALFQSHDVVVIEDLKIRNMLKNRRLAKAISDAGWYQFRVWLDRYSRIFNKTLIVVPPNYTSQDCSNCGKRTPKKLSERIHSCECGLVLDRDHNAALNILQKGLELNGTVGHTETTCLMQGTPAERRASANV